MHVQNRGEKTVPNGLANNDIKPLKILCVLESYGGFRPWMQYDPKTVREHARGDAQGTVAPGAYGLSTIWDKDVLIVCCSQLLEGIKQGSAPHPVGRFEVFDLLISTNRSTGQKGYGLLKGARDRLHGPLPTIRSPAAKEPWDTTERQP